MGSNPAKTSFCRQAYFVHAEFTFCVHHSIRIFWDTGLMEIGMYNMTDQPVADADQHSLSHPKVGVDDRGFM